MVDRAPRSARKEPAARWLSRSDGVPWLLVVIPTASLLMALVLVVALSMLAGTPSASYRSQSAGRMDAPALHRR